MSLFSLIFSAWAASFAGVSFPDTIIIDNQNLNLNGIGLREKFWVDVYVAALYIPEKSSDYNKIIYAETPKKIELEFIYHTVTKEKMLASLKENLVRNPKIAKAAENDLKKVYSWFQDFHSKDTLSFEYVPNIGTTIHINKKNKGTIEGSDFMIAIFTIYLGPKPASEALKSKLLGK